MKIETDLTNQANHIDTSDIRTILDKIKMFEIYDEFTQIYVPNDCKMSSVNAMVKKQNVNAWSSKCNYIMHYMKKDFEQCIEFIEDDQDLFVGFRISEKDKEKFYLLENIEYRIFTLCDVLAQMYNELWSIESHIGKINHSFFFSRKEIETNILNNYSDSKMQQFLLNEVKSIAAYFKKDADYKYIAEKRNSFTHRENPHDCVMLNGSKKKFLIDHPLYELNECIKVFEWIYLRICTVQKMFFFLLKNMGMLENYKIAGVEKW